MIVISTDSGGSWAVGWMFGSGAILCYNWTYVSFRNKNQSSEKDLWEIKKRVNMKVLQIFQLVKIWHPQLHKALETSAKQIGIRTVVERGFRAFFPINSFLFLFML